MTQETKVPKWFYIVGIIALIWNMLGLMAFVGHIMMTPEMIAKLPEAEQALYQNNQPWATIAFATAVITGTLGCILILLKKALAKSLFILSFVAVIVQNFHAFYIIDSLAVYGSTSVIMPSLVAIVGLLLIWLSTKATRRGWLK
ncbi:hypothetical protein [Thalassotalea sediminis]|uniref:hypothetical protein n=1 Tax=Thalassotalea sediminis TaxID=1759089 RepID=UPI0025745EED|nr:hypothetical protein [Thalassotalea sediminis]